MTESSLPNPADTSTQTDPIEAASTPLAFSYEDGFTHTD
jgi:hypothetical protein